MVEQGLSPRNLDKVAVSGMELRDGTHQILPDTMLIIHAAVKYELSQGLGVGLLQRVACARTGTTREDILKPKKRGYKFTNDDFVDHRTDGDMRAYRFALWKALDLALETVQSGWPSDMPPATVVIFLPSTQECKELLEFVTYHIEHEPESLKGAVRGPEAIVVRRIIHTIKVIRAYGWKVKLTKTTHALRRTQKAARTVAKAKFKKIFRDKRQSSINLPRGNNGRGPGHTSMPKKVVSTNRSRGKTVSAMKADPTLSSCMATM